MNPIMQATKALNPIVFYISILSDINYKEYLTDKDIKGAFKYLRKTLMIKNDESGGYVDSFTPNDEDIKYLQILLYDQFNPEIFPELWI